MIKLVNVYGYAGSFVALWELMLERIEDPDINISHREMPTWADHEAFCVSLPDFAWYLIKDDDGSNSDESIVGAVYLTKQNEIGISIFSKYCGNGFGQEAIKQIIAKHPRSRYLANINPKNSISIKLFKKQGFELLQQTYELRREI